MGFLDDAKDKVADLAEEHPDKVSDGLDKAGELLDEKTGGKFGDQIDKGVDTAKDKLGVDGGDEG